MSAPRAWNIEQDRGRTWEEAEAELIAMHPEHEENIRNFRRHWHEMVPHAYDDSVALMERLIDNGHDVTHADQFRRRHVRRGAQALPVSEKPRGVTVSGEIKADQAGPRHLRPPCRDFGLDPAASLFIDDSQKNVDGAKAAGWQAVLFTDAPTLENDLVRLGVRV